MPKRRKAPQCINVRCAGIKLMPLLATALLRKNIYIYVYKYYCDMGSYVYTLHSRRLKKKNHRQDCRSADVNHTSDLLNQTEGNTIGRCYTIISPGKSLVKGNDTEVTRLAGTIIWLRSTFILIGTRTVLKSLFIIPDFSASYQRDDIGEFPLLVVSLAFSPICTWRRLTAPTHALSISFLLSF